MRILITGGAGAIGRECTAQFLAAGHRVVVLDLRAMGLPAVRGLVRVQGNILNAADRARSLRGVDGVVHLAAVSRVQEAEEDPKAAERTNVSGTERIIEDAARLASPPWFVHASSREVYGEPRAIPVAESVKVRPFNIYGRTKAQSELVVEAVSVRRGMRATILRFANVYGSTYDRPRRVIPSFVRRALRNEELMVYDGRKLFDFVYVRDAGRAVVAASRHVRREPDGALLTANVATGTGTRLQELASMIIAQAGSRAGLNERPAMAFDVRRFVGDPSLAKRRLGFACETAIQDGLRKTVAAFRRPPGARSRPAGRRRLVAGW